MQQFVLWQQNLMDQSDGPLGLGCTAVVQRNRLPLVFNLHACRAQIGLPGSQPKAHGIQHLPEKTGHRRLLGVFGAMVAHDKLRLKTQAPAHILNRAAGDDGHWQSCRQQCQPGGDTFGDAGQAGSRHDGGQRAVKIKRQQGILAQEGGQSGLAVGGEEVPHTLLRLPNQPSWWRRTRASMRARRRQRPASASIRPAQRKTLNSCTVLRRLAMRSRCSAAGMLAAR